MGLVRYAVLLYEGARLSHNSRSSLIRREALQVRGVVQGVGFRPFVYRIAKEEGLAGFIGNDTDGVTIEVEGPAEHVDAFRARLTAEAPPLSRIDSVAHAELPVSGESGFRIVASEIHGQVSTGIPADAATCANCLRELLDPADRRYRYPFLNCTNCGPRFTITRRIPYDRPQTSMAVFKMCPACQAEYDDPANRRFHAQPNACWVCGPRLWLADAEGTEIPSHDPVAACIDRLMRGEIMAIKGIGGFHLSVDATNESAVMRLRARKHRYGKPLAVMVRDIAAARALCVLGADEDALLTTPARPIVLARRREDSGVAPSVAPGIPWLGVYLPYAPLQHLLFADERVHALVMTSANLSEEPIAIDNDEARARLGQIADAFLMHDREILQRCDDSVMAVVDSAPQIIRRARGYVPLGVSLPFESAPLLAVGGHLKNVFTLARGRFAYQSQHLGDLENVTGLDFFRESLEHLMHTFEIEPQVVVHDLHPGYLSTGWAKEWAAERGLPLIAVQHHHAHIAACMAEHGLEGPVIGLSLDGTGYGTDGRIWGGEVLIARLDGFERFAHLDYVPMPGGESAIREPWRMTFGHLHAAGVDAAEALALLGVSEKEGRILSRMIERGLNVPLTSSLGRLFDAVAAVVLSRREVDYEAQAAIELEGVAVDEPAEVEGAYKLEWLQGNWARREAGTLSSAPIWRAIISDLRVGVSRAQIAARFHAGVTESIVRVAMAAREASGITQVAMSGGCLHNRRLAASLHSRLEREGFAVYRQKLVSPGDGGLSFGQAVVASASMKARSPRSPRSQ
jgi:hydrogenase maturation protein HypF